MAKRHMKITQNFQFVHFLLILHIFNMLFLVHSTEFHEQANNLYQNFSLISLDQKGQEIKSSIFDREKFQSKSQTNQSSCSCGVKTETEFPSSRIIDGESVNPDEFIPWRCALLYKRASGFHQQDNFVYFYYSPVCSCTILSKRWILSAAHCTDPNDFPGLTIYVLAGANSLTLDDEAADNLIRVKKVINHPNYESLTKFNELSLLELSRGLPFDDPQRVSPVCLPYKFQRDKFYKRKILASGFGTASLKNPLYSNTLRKVELPILTTTQCKRLYKKTGIEITNQMICTSTINEKDTCFGDSGGSIDMRDEETGKYHAIGIVSFGLRCASRFPGVYTKVTKYLRYIENATGEKFCRA